MENKHLGLGVLCSLLLAPSLGAQTPTTAQTPTATINTAEMARQARLPHGAAPQGLVATASSPTSITLTWIAAAGATGYLVYRGASADESNPPIATVSPATASTAAPVSRLPALRIATATSAVVPPVTYLDNGVTPHSTRYYRVAATYADQQAGLSEVVSASTPLASQPTGFRAIAGLGSVTLFWHPAPGAAGYMLSRDNSVFLNNQQLIHDTTYVDDGLWPRTFTYRLIAYYTVQGLGEVTGDMTQVPAVVATPQASSPKDFRMDPYYGGTDVSFRWTPFHFERWEQYGKVVIYTAKGYRVLRALASDGNFAEVPGVQYSGLEGDPSKYEFARDNTVQVGQTYLYKLETMYSAPPFGESEVLRVEVKAKP